MKTIIEICYSLADIDQAAAEFYAVAKNYRVWAFSGQLGAGKTTFTSALCRMLKVLDPVSSPTFSLINEYSAVETSPIQKIYHADLYRLADEEEAIQAGIEDLFGAADSIVIIEWWERAASLLPQDTLFAYFSVEDADKRQIVLKA